MDWFKLHDDLQNETYGRFNAYLHFLSIMLREGGKFIINGAKRCF